ncbi:MAG: DUF6893 family small protein [Mycobacteriales bacterium]
MVKKIVLGLAVAGVSGAVIASLPDVKRYLKMRSM